MMKLFPSDEVWKDVPEYEGIYQASNYGEIRSVEGKTTCNKRHGKRVWKSRVLKGRGDKYTPGKRVSLWKNGKAKDFLVARLVATTFLGVPPEGYTVNHKDGNRLNNRVENLEWLSIGDNIRHAFDTGLINTQKPITIAREKGGEVFSFRSFSSADRLLHHTHGYTSQRLKRNHYTLFDANGDLYRVV